MTIFLTGFCPFLDDSSKFPLSNTESRINFWSIYWCTSEWDTYENGVDLYSDVSRWWAVWTVLYGYSLHHNKGEQFALLKAFINYFNKLSFMIKLTKLIKLVSHCKAMFFLMIWNDKCCWYLCTFQRNITMIENTAVRDTMLNVTLKALAPKFPFFQKSDYELWFQINLVILLASFRPSDLVVMPTNISCDSYDAMWVIWFL